MLIASVPPSIVARLFIVSLQLCPRFRTSQSFMLLVSQRCTAGTRRFIKHDTFQYSTETLISPEMTRIRRNVSFVFFFGTCIPGQLLR